MRYASTVHTLFDVTGLVLAALLCASSVSSAQSPAVSRVRSQGSGSTRQARPVPRATVRVTVADQTGAVIVGATVAVTAADGASVPNTEKLPASTDETGVATISELAPGTYTILVSFPGFDSRVLTGVRLRAGENRQSVTLPIKTVEAEVTVERDRQGAAADPRASGLGTALSSDDIEALSDDPDTLQQQLNELAGPGAVVRVDGFQGNGLPPKAQIQSVRIARDQFSAEHHDAGGVSIEIITKPGLGPLRFRLNTLGRQGQWGGRSPFVEVKGPDRNVNFGLGLGGALVKDRSSFNLNVSGNTGFDTPNLFTAVPGGGRVSRALPLRASRTNIFVNGQVDYAVSPAHVLRLAVTRNQGRSDNAGVGGYNEPERAFSTTNANTVVRLQHSGPISSRAFSRSRLQIGWSGNKAVAATEAVTLRVLDAFTRGGAQRAGGDRNRNVDVESDVDYVFGRHAIRVGATLFAGRYSSDATANYLGEYTFESLDAYLAGTPRLFTQRVGDPRIAYRMVRTAAYVQDDVRVRRGLTVSAGLRYEWQSHAGDRADLGPRAGVTWAPFASGRTTLRSSVGLFYDWLPSSTYDQVQRVDGFHQRELSITNPAFEATEVGGGVIPPINRYLLQDRYRLPRIARVSAGLDQRVISNTRIGVTYSYQHGSRAARGLNLNAPVAGVRPDSAFANVIEVVSDAAFRQHELDVDASIHPGALVPTMTGPRISLRRTTLFVNYTLASLRNNTDGPFTPPATGSLDAEWGPARGADVRHRLNLSLNNQLVRNLMMGLTLNASSAPSYPVLTGRDDNGDGLFNDRPAGVGRNTERATAQVVLNTNIAYAFAFGPPAAPPAGRAGAVTASPGRYRLQLFVQALNLTNRRNYVGFSGVATSPFFGQPTGVSSMRRIDLGTTLNF